MTFAIQYHSKGVKPTKKNTFEMKPHWCWITTGDPGYHWDTGRHISYGTARYKPLDSHVYSDAKTFETIPEAMAYMKTWTGHPFWSARKPNDPYVIVQVEYTPPPKVMSPYKMLVQSKIITKGKMK